MNVKMNEMVVFAAALAMVFVSGCNLDDEGPTVGNNVDTGTNVDTNDGGTADMSAPVDMGDEPDMGGTDAGMTGERLTVFDDNYAPGVGFSTFGGATNNVQIVAGEGVGGSSAIRVPVPSDGYTGGALVGSMPQDLRPYDAIRFSVRASKAASLNVAGFGNATTSAVRQVELRAQAVGTEWVELIIPVPATDDVAQTSGLFHFAEGSDEGAYDLFFDDIAYIELPENEVAFTGASFEASTSALFIGSTRNPPEASLTAAVSGDVVSMAASGAYLEWTSSNPAVATVDSLGVVTGVTGGTTDLTARFAGLDATGSIALTVVEGPAQAAPVPTSAPADVIAALYSNAYTPVPVNTFRAPFSVAELANIQIDGNDTLLYTSLDFAGIEMLGPNSLNISEAGVLHIDVWTNNAQVIRIKLVDFGPDNAFQGADDSEGEVELTAGGTGSHVRGQWTTLKIPIDRFGQNGLVRLRNLSQIILVGLVQRGGELFPGEAVVFVDNIYFGR